MEGPRERIEHQSQVLERHEAQQRRIAWLAKDDGTVAFAHRKGDVALGDIPFDSRSVSESETCSPFRRHSDGRPGVVRQQRVRRTAVDKKIECPASPRPGYGTFNVRNTHE